MIRIYSLKLERELNERERQQALDILTPERKAKALRFRRLEDQSKGMATGLLEEYVLWKEYGISADKIRIGQGTQGKPFLIGQENVHYNLSHAGNWIVCGVGDVSLGIDVEQEKKYSERLVRRFFHEEEVADILSSSEEERSKVFAMYWTMKESFMKLCGLGFSLPLSSFQTNRKTGEITILPLVSKENKQVLLEQGLLGNQKPVCQWIPLETGYQCCICTKKLQPIEVCKVSLEDCMNHPG
ncbi:MAG: 4'-phosphopantetheinyl transferase superfamily protein [Lachnospiraceae bacterium]|nr:4'-phosphopantetheinyl transferase superfamily protein [Lachnospiraceae bacterium]MBP3508061.1 4'-phosphopantetheinyl transferase superfamily protein [Lachnospiraceae bacterium]